MWPEVPDLLRQLPMGDLYEEGWNCQNWVLEAIAALNHMGYLEVDQAGMANVKSRHGKKRKDAH